MKEKKSDETQRRHIFIKYAGIMVLALFMLVSIAGAAPFAYVTNNGDNTVSVIDTATDTIKATVNVGDQPYGVAVSPNGTKVYVTSRLFLDVTDSWEGDTVEIGTVSVIDTATNNVTASVNVGVGPQGVAVSPDGTKVYVTNEGSDTGAISTVSVIDTATNTVTATVNVGIRPRGIAVTPDGTKVYVMNYGSNNISIIDTANDTVTATVNAENPWGIAISPDRTKVYVTNNGENVSVIDTATNTVTGTVSVGGLLDGVAVSPDGTKVYVTNGWYKGDDGPYYALDIGTVSVIDTATNTITATVGVGSIPSGVAVSPDGTKVYVTNFGSENVSVIDAATNTVTASVNVGSMPIGVAVTPAPEPEIQRTQITTSESASDPHIYGDRIVWEEIRDGKSDIYMYDLSTKQEAQISTSGTANYPAIYDNRIVWYDSRNGKCDVYMYDLSTQQETQISTSGTAYASYPGPDIYKDKIVWGEFGEYIDSTNLVMYNISTQQETQITNSGSGGVSTRGFYGFAIYGDKIVMGKPGGDDHSSIFMYDLSTSQEIGVSSGGSAGYPDIYGDKIVWHDGRNGDDYNRISDIYMYDISTQQETQISTSGEAYAPAIYGNRMVWEDYRSGRNIYIYDLSNSKETQITTSGSALDPGIYGNRIVWVDGNDIYIGTLNYPAYPVANFTSDITEGYAPLTVQFTDLSTNATSWNWDFGDGATSIEQSPMHTYLAAGNYTVNLTVNNLNGTDSKTATITVLQSIPPVSGKQFAYITNQGSDSVSVIDMATKTITATIPVGDGPSGVAVSPAGTKVYVTNSGNNTVSVINTANNTVTSTVNVGNAPYGVAVSPDGTLVYVTNLNDNSVSVINTAMNQVIYTITVGKWPEGVAFTPDGEKAYVANYYSYSTISVIDTATNTVISTVNDPEIYGPSGIAIAPNGKKAYVTSNFNDKLVVMDLLSNQVITTVNVESGPHGISVSPDGTRVYVVNGEGNTISVIDTATDEVIAMVPVGNGPYGIAVSPDGKTVSVTNRQSNDVSMIDTATNKVIATVPVEVNPASFGQFIGSVPAVLPVANFTSNITEGYVPLSVQFTDLSTNANSWNWDFGDGTTSTDQNTTHTYSVAGTYNVNLTVSNTKGTDSKLATITVLKQPVAPVADFSASPTEGKVPLTVTFTDQSTGSPTSWSWKFGDKIISPAQNPEHIYSKAGKYTVSLTVKNKVGSDTRKIYKYIIVKSK